MIADGVTGVLAFAEVALASLFFYHPLQAGNPGFPKQLVVIPESLNNFSWTFAIYIAFPEFFLTGDREADRVWGHAICVFVFF